MRTGPRAAAVLTVLAVLAPLAIASASAGDTPLGVAAARGRASITFDQGGDVVPGQPHAVNLTVTHCAASAGRHALTLHAVDAPPWLNVTFRPETYRFHASVPDECESATGLAILTAGPGAPGLTLASVKLRAVDATGAEAARTEYGFRVGHRGNLTVETPWRAVKLPSGGHAQFNVYVQNHGNADAVVRLQVAGLPPSVQAAVPAPAMVPAGEDGSPGERTLPMALMAPDDAPDAFTLHVVVTSRLAMDANQAGDGGVYAVQVEPRSGGLPPLLPALGLGIAGVAALFALRGRLAGLVPGARHHGNLN